MLAEAFAEPLTEERMEIYIRALADIQQDRLRISFQRALQELTWFPKVAELRNLAATPEDASKEDEVKVEADAAWTYVNDYLRQWGVDQLPLYSTGGQSTQPPPLDPRTDYALRRIGGFQALHQMDINRMPFIYRDFCEAYAQAPLAERLAPRLEERFGSRAASHKVNALAKPDTSELRRSLAENNRKP